MKKLKEIFKRVMTAIPGARAPESLEEAQADILQDSSYISTMKRWAGNVGVTALALGGLALFAKTGLVLIPALAAGGLWGALQGGIALIRRDLRKNREAEAEFIAAATAAPEEPSPAPAPSIAPEFGAKATNDNKDRIKALETQLAEVEVQAESKRKLKELGL